MTTQEFLDGLTTQQLENLFHAHIDDFEQLDKPLPLSFLAGYLRLDISGLAPEDCPTFDDITNALFDRANVAEADIVSLLERQRPARPGRTAQRRRPLRLSWRLAAVVLLLVLTAVCAIAAVFKPYIHIFGANSGTLDYYPSGALDTVNPQATYPNIPDALAAEGISASAPTWVPARFALDIVEVLDTQSGTSVSAWFVAEDGDNLSFLYLLPAENYAISIESDNNLDHSLDNAPVSQQDENIEIYIYNEIEHIITNNMDIPLAEWFHNGAVVSIGGDVTLAELKNIIQSIYEVVT